MTISTYVLSLLLTLTLIAHNHLMQKRAIPHVHAAYIHAKAAARTQRNQAALERHSLLVNANKAPPPPKRKPKGPAKEKKVRARTESEQKIYSDDRRARRASCRSKLNLAPLSATPLRPVAIRLLCSLYEETPLFKDNPTSLQTLAPLIIDRLLGRQSSLTEALNEMRSAHPILYKMLRGTAHYNLETKQGYPPLSDFFTLDPQYKKAVHFHYASIPLLDALFGHRLRTLICALEKKKWEAFSSYSLVRTDEAFAVFVKEKKSALYDELQPHLSFAK